jgi:hypothetical protein
MNEERMGEVNRGKTENLEKTKGRKEKGIKR